MLGQHGSCSVAQLPVELSENMLQNIFLNLPPHSVCWLRNKPLWGPICPKVACNLPVLLIHILSGPYCTIIIEAEGWAVAPTKKLRLHRLGNLCVLSKTMGGNLYRKCPFYVENCNSSVTNINYVRAVDICDFMLWLLLLLVYNVHTTKQTPNMTKVRVAYWDSHPTLYVVHGRAKPVLLGPCSTEPSLFHHGETTYGVGWLSEYATLTFVILEVCTLLNRLYTHRSKKKDAIQQSLRQI